MFKRISSTEWEWHDSENAVNHAVRLFADNQRLIWSGWMPGSEPSEPPVYQAGLAQTFAHFLAEGSPPSVMLPAELIEPISVEIQRLLRAPSS